MGNRCIWRNYDIYMGYRSRKANPDPSPPPTPVMPSTMKLEGQPEPHVWEPLEPLNPWPVTHPCAATSTNRGSQPRWPRQESGIRSRPWKPPVLPRSPRNLGWRKVLHIHYWSSHDSFGAYNRRNKSTYLTHQKQEVIQAGRDNPANLNKFHE